MTDLDALERAYRESTPSDWHVWDGPQYQGGGADLCIGSGDKWLANMDHAYCKCDGVFENDHRNETCPICTIDAPEITREQRANADFIAHAHNAWPSVSKELRELRQRVAELEAESSAIASCMPTDIATLHDDGTEKTIVERVEQLAGYYCALKRRIARIEELEKKGGE